MRGLSVTRRVTYTALSVAFLTVGAIIQIPWALPITLQVLSLYLVLFLFGGTLGLASSALYLAMGIIGLPVFSGFSGGFGRLFELGGGYIVAFIPLSLVYLLCERLRVKRLFAAFISLLVMYAAAYLWHALLYFDGDFGAQVLLTVLAPYVIPDALKIIIAYVIAGRLEKYSLINVR